MYIHIYKLWGFSSGSHDKEFACIAGDPGLLPGFIRSPGEGNGNTLQYSCLEDSMDRGTWQAGVHGGYNTTVTRVEYN